ncbi:MAG: phosphoribosylanthranilate isomerase [Acidiferrobacterales bacterium]
MRTRVKICGITRVEDALAVAQLGADAIGLVFYNRSPRRVSVDQARAIARSLPPFVTRVGVFLDLDDEDVQVAIAAVGLDVLQFHGDEPAETYRAFGRPYIKAVRMQDGVDLYAEQQVYADAAGLLLDAYVANMPGGSGQAFDWSRVPQDLEKPVILAGGLTPDNVRAAITAVRPFAVDVSTGVEKSKGIKDVAKVSAFIKNVKEVQ